MSEWIPLPLLFRVGTALAWTGLSVLLVQLATRLPGAARPGPATSDRARPAAGHRPADAVPVRGAKPAGGTGPGQPGAAAVAPRAGPRTGHRPPTGAAAQPGTRHEAMVR